MMFLNLSTFKVFGVNINKESLILLHAYLGIETPSNQHSGKMLIM